MTHQTGRPPDTCQTPETCQTPGKLKPADLSIQEIQTTPIALTVQIAQATQATLATHAGSRYAQRLFGAAIARLANLGTRRIIIAGLMIVLVCASIGAARLHAGFGANRTLSFYNIHNKERVTIQFKKNGKYVPAAMQKLNWILRDWRRNQPTKMDPKLLDLIWQIYTELGAKKPIHIISGFRSLKTNNMLRRTRGGQAKRSQHILGKAMDIYFPDVPLKKLRYSALVRQQGGVGYYPTSAIPFVHVDTGRVRHWPRLPRYELALLFPKGSSLHRPARGRPINAKDVRIAQSRHKRLAVQIASFHNRRKGTSPAIVVAARQPAPRATARKPETRAATRKPAPRQRIAALNTSPRLKGTPALARRRTNAPAQPAGTSANATAGAAEWRAATTIASSATATGPSRPNSTQPSRQERRQLAALARAATQNQPRLIRPPQAAPRRSRARLASLGASIPPAALASFTGAASPQPVVAPQTAEGWSNGWVQAPAYDEEHPDEMSYRPFPIAPLLTASASPDDPALIHLTHPDAVKTLDLLDGIDTIPPLQFRPGAQYARLLLHQQFIGKAVDLDSLYGRAPANAAARAGQAQNNNLNNRRVTTQGG